MTNDDDVITTEDVAWLNGRLVARSARNARIAGTVLIAVGVVGVVLNLWLNWRYQDRLESGSGNDLGSSFGTPQQVDVGWMDRLDWFSQLYGLEVPVLAIAVGFGLHLFADYTVARTGGSVGEVAVGDPVPTGPDDDDDADGPDGGDPGPVLPPDPEGFEPRS